MIVVQHLCGWKALVEADQKSYRSPLRTSGYGSGTGPQRKNPLDSD